MSCETSPTVAASDANVTSRMSTPSMRHDPPLWLVQARDEVRERRLARARLADERRARARRDLRADLLQRPRRARRVAEPHLAQPHGAAHVLQRACVRALDDVDRQVEVLEDPPEQRQRRLHFQPHRQQRLDREQQARLQRRERDDRPDRDRVAARPVVDPREQVHERRHDREAHLHRRHPPAPGHPRAHLEVGELARLAAEAPHELRRAAHRLAEQDPRDRQRLLDERRHVRQAALAHRLDPPALLADATRQPHEERQQHQRERRQAPVEQEHRDDRRDDSRHVLHDRRRRRRHDAVDPADVVRDPRLHLARARAREERKRHPLQVRVHGRAQVVHHALADLVGDPRLRDADHARDDRQRDHPRDELDHERRVVPRVRLVDEFPQQERADHAEPRRHEDQRQQ